MFRWQMCKTLYVLLRGVFYVVSDKWQICNEAAYFIFTWVIFCRFLAFWVCDKLFNVIISVVHIEPTYSGEYVPLTHILETQSLCNSIAYGKINATRTLDSFFKPSVSLTIFFFARPKGDGKTLSDWPWTWKKKLLYLPQKVFYGHYLEITRSSFIIAHLPHIVIENLSPKLSQKETIW